MRAAERLRAVTIAVSLASFPFILPHVVEDFEHGIAARVGLSTGVGAFLLGGFLGLQSLGLVHLARGRRGGFLLTLLVAAIWLAGALIEHGRVLLGPANGATSRLWLVGLLMTQAGCLVLAAMGWRRG